MPGSKLSPCATIIQITFIIFNIIFSVIGAVVLALGIFLAVEGRDYDFITGSSILSGAGLLIAAGVITFCIAAVGFVGACFKLRPLLVAFAVALILIVVLEIAAAVVGVVHRATVETTIQEEYTTAWQNAILEYNTNPDSPDYMADANNAVDTLQERLKCCGAEAPSDWGELNPQALQNLTNMLPSSCNCTPSEGVENCSSVIFSYNTTASDFYTINQTAWTVGCVNATVDATRALLVIAVGAGFVFGIIEIFGIVISLGLVCCITSSLRKEIV